MIRLENKPISPELQNCVDKLPLAMAYVPIQQLDKMYPPETALERGPLFPELDLPFEGETVPQRGQKGGTK